jgi:hypothetical protein
MKSTETSQAPASLTRHEQCRREALKKFARFGATVPAVMLLLSPNLAHAGGRHHRRRHRRHHRHRNRRGGGYEG